MELAQNQLKRRRTTVDILLQREVVPYLIDCGLLTSGEAVCDAFHIIDLSRRNRNFAAIHEEGPSYFLKQATNADTAITLEREFAAYQFFDASRKRTFASSLAAYMEYDSSRGILILELLPASKTVREHHMATARFSVELGRRMGRILGDLHVHPEQSDSWEVAVPAALTFDAPDLALIRSSSAATQQLLAMLQGAPGLSDRLRELASSWNPETTIHGDARWDNWLRVAEPADRGFDLKLLDWELWGQGDSRWDVGCVLGDYLGLWLDGLPTAEGVDAQTMLEASRYPLERMHGATRGFVEAYLEQRGVGQQESRAIILGAVSFAGVRLLQACFESCHHVQRMGGGHILRLQVAMNVVSRPEAAAYHLLGLDLPTSSARS